MQNGCRRRGEWVSGVGRCPELESVQVFGGYKPPRHIPSPHPSTHSPPKASLAAEQKDLHKGRAVGGETPVKNCLFVPLSLLLPPTPPHPPATTGEAADGSAGPSVGKQVQGKQEPCFTREGDVPACPQCLLRPVVRARRGVHPAGPPAQTRLLIAAGARPSRSEQDPRQHRVLPRLAPTGI